MGGELPGLLWSLVKLGIILAFLPHILGLALVVGVLSGLFSAATGGGRSRSGSGMRRARRPRRAEGAYKRRMDIILKAFISLNLS